MLIHQLALSTLNFNLWFSILIICCFVGALLVPIIYEHVSSWLSYTLASRRYYKAEKKMRDGEKRDSDDGGSTIDELIGTAGYAYSPKKDIFFSTMNAWQRSMGYCQLYDEAAAPLGMIIDCEPVRFSYGGKRWLIEFWKGQYGMTSGCEVGVYSSTWPDLRIPGIFDGTFYTCTDNNDRLYMAFILYKNGEVMMSRKDKHWWLTGFKLGEFSHPSELSMDVYITFKNRGMRDAFLTSLQKLGYTEEEFEVRKTTVALHYDKPKNRQPFTRSVATDKLMLDRLKVNCDIYQALTKDYKNIKQKLTAVQSGSPELFAEIFKIGKTAAVFSVFEKLKGFLKF